MREASHASPARSLRKPFPLPQVRPDTPGLALLPASQADPAPKTSGNPSSPPALPQVRPDTPALDAMILMETRNISAVAVVAASGSIIANFSISELR